MESCSDAESKLCDIVKSSTNIEGSFDTFSFWKLFENIQLLFLFLFCSINIKGNILRREIKENIWSKEKELKIKKGREYLKLILNVVDINITGYYYRYNE
ncbi:hypothetical protein ACKWTF_009821 [Chironomus riparius]